MNWDIVIKEIGIVGIISGTTIWGVKKLGEFYISKKIKSYEFELQQKTESTNHYLDKSLENHRNELNLILSKSSRLYEKRLEIVHTLYGKLSLLDRAMKDMTATSRFVSGDEKKDEKAETDRIILAKDYFIDFQDYFYANRIFFSESACNLIDVIIESYNDGFWDYTVGKRFGFTNVDLNMENAKKAAEKIQNHIPPILKELENQFRFLIGVENNK